MTAAIGAAWDRHAGTYARLFAPLTGYLAQSLFHTAAGRLPPAPRILDVACGAGELARAAVLHCLAERGGSGACGQVVATDLSPGMVGLCTRNLAALDAGDVFRCEVADGQALGFDAGSFDAVFSSFGVFLFPDRAAGWREAARVLRPGGLLGTAVWRGPEDNEMARVQMGAVFAALPEHVRAGLPRPAWLEVSTREGLGREVAAAGFSDVEITVLDAAFTAPRPAALWGAMRENPVTGGLLSRCTDEELAQVERAVVASFEAMAGGADRPLRMNASCHLLVARRA